MRAMLRWLVATVAVLAFTSSGIRAATLTGDTINQSDPANLLSVISVNPGIDFTQGFIAWNYNAGAFGNQLVISLISPATTFLGMYQLSGTSTVTLSDLNFSDGETLTGFTVLTSIYPITVNILSASSLSLSWVEGTSFSGPSIFLQGEFVTSPSEVPLPAALPLFATVLAGGALIAWRRKRRGLP